VVSRAGICLFLVGVWFSSALRWSEPKVEVRSSPGAPNKGPRSRLWRWRWMSADLLDQLWWQGRSLRWQLLRALGFPGRPWWRGGSRVRESASSSGVGTGAILGVVVSPSKLCWLPWWRRQMLLLESDDIWSDLKGAFLRCLSAACSSSLWTQRLEVNRSRLLHLPGAVLLLLL
jgi:hypothetical protein